MTIPKEVTIREVGPREGVQTSEIAVATKDKLALIELLSDTGVKEIEITSLVRADRVPQMADAEEIIQSYTARPGVRYSALYLNEKGFERGEKSGRLGNAGWIHLAASESFLKRNNNITLEEGINTIPAWLESFARYGKKLHGLMLSSSFACAYEGLIAPEKLISTLHQVVSVCTKQRQPLEEVCLADTIGHANPETVRSLVRTVRQNFPKLIISLHLHDTYGFGIANVYAGLLEGVSIFDGSVAGIGGCPFMKGAAGNVATEKIVLLCHEMGIQTGISLEGYLRAARFASKLFGRTGFSG